MDESTGNGPSAAPSAPDELQGVIELLEQLDRELDAGDARSVADHSGAAQENRAIRGATVALALQRARDAQSTLSGTHEHARRVTSDARATREASAAERQARRAERPPGRRAELSEILSRAAHGLVRYENLDEALELIVRGALDAVPAADRAGVTLAHKHGPVESRAPSDEVVRELDRLQADLAEGPCVDAVWRSERVVVPDQATMRRWWPRFAAAAQERAVGSMASFRLFQDGSAGALNLYSGTSHAFDDFSLDTALVYASHAALVLRGATRIEGLNTALLSRDVIGQAKGILIERFGADAEGAFAMLVSSSQETNMKLVDVAHWVVEETVRRRPTF